MIRAISSKIVHIALQGESALFDHLIVDIRMALLFADPELLIITGFTHEVEGPWQSSVRKPKTTQM